MEGEKGDYKGNYLKGKNIIL